jgi:uncharacterized surface protein with fasciclin (FAS1) repeats
MNESKSASASQHGSTTNTAATKNVVDTAIAAGMFTKLVAGIKTAGLTDKFTGQEQFTIFAPTDEAFKKLPSGALEALLKDSAKLKAVLSYHVVTGHLWAKDMKSGRHDDPSGYAAHRVRIELWRACKWGAREASRYRCDQWRPPCHRCSHHAEKLAIAGGRRLMIARR